MYETMLLGMLSLYDYKKRKTLKRYMDGMPKVYEYSRDDIEGKDTKPHREFLHLFYTVV